MMKRQPKIGPKIRGISAGVAVAILLLIILTFFATYNIINTYLSSQAQLSEYVKATQKPRLVVENMDVEKDYIRLTIANTGPVAVFVSRIYLMEYSSSNTPTNSIILPVNEYLDVGATKEITMRISENPNLFFGENRPLRIVFDTDRGLIMTAYPPVKGQLIINIHLPRNLRGFTISSVQAVRIDVYGSVGAVISRTLTPETLPPCPINDTGQDASACIRVLEEENPHENTQEDYGVIVFRTSLLPGYYRVQVKALVDLITAIIPSTETYASYAWDAVSQAVPLVDYAETQVPPAKTETIDMYLEKPPLYYVKKTPPTPSAYMIDFSLISSAIYPYESAENGGWSTSNTEKFYMNTTQYIRDLIDNGFILYKPNSTITVGYYPYQSYDTVTMNIPTGYGSTVQTIMPGAMLTGLWFRINNTNAVNGTIDINLPEITAGKYLPVVVMAVRDTDAFNDLSATLYVRYNDTIIPVVSDTIPSSILHATIGSDTGYEVMEYVFPEFTKRTPIKIDEGNLGFVLHIAFSAKAHDNNPSTHDDHPAIIVSKVIMYPVPKPLNTYSCMFRYPDPFLMPYAVINTYNCSIAEVLGRLYVFFNSVSGDHQIGSTPEVFEGQPGTCVLNSYGTEICNRVNSGYKLEIWADGGSNGVHVARITSYEWLDIMYSPQPPNNPFTVHFKVYLPEPGTYVIGFTVANLYGTAFPSASLLPKVVVETQYYAEVLTQPPVLDVLLQESQTAKKYYMVVQSEGSGYIVFAIENSYAPVDPYEYGIRDLIVVKKYSPPANTYVIGGANSIGLYLANVTVIGQSPMIEIRKSSTITHSLPISNGTTIFVAEDALDNITILENTAFAVQDTYYLPTEYTVILYDTWCPCSTSVSTAAASTASLAASTLSTASLPGLAWHYRYVVQVYNPLQTRVDWLVVVGPLDWGGINLDPNSIRVRDANGNDLPFKKLTYNGQDYVVFQATLPGGSTSTFYIYFDSISNGPFPPPTTILSWVDGIKAMDDYYIVLKLASNSAFEQYNPDSVSQTVGLGDIGTFTYNAPFDVPFYGTDYSTLYVSADGIIKLTNWRYNLFDTTIQGPAIAPFFDNLVTLKLKYGHVLSTQHSLDTITMYYDSTVANGAAEMGVVIYETGDILIMYGNITSTDTLLVNPYGYSFGYGIAESDTNRQLLFLGNDPSAEGLSDTSLLFIYRPNLQVSYYLETLQP